MAAIFGEDELLRHPPDPFEEKILTGRNSFDDLRAQLAQESDESAGPSSTPRRPSGLGSATGTTRPRPVRDAVPRDDSPAAPTLPMGSTGASSEAQGRIAELRRDLAARTAARTAGADAASAAPTTPSRFFHGDPASGTGASRPTGVGSRRPTGLSDAAPATNPSSSDERIAALRRDLSTRQPAAAPAPAPEPLVEEPPARVRPAVSRPTPSGVSRPQPRPRPAGTPTGAEPVRTRPRPQPPVVDEDIFEPLTAARPAPAVKPYVEEPPIPAAETEVRVPQRRPRPTRPAPPVVEDEVVAVDEEPVDLAPEPEVVEPAVAEPVAPEPEVDFVPAPTTRRPAAKPAAPAPKPVPQATRVPAAPTGPAVVTVSGLTKTYGKAATTVEALRGVDLTVAEGSLTAVMGPSGAGKSTLLHLLAGLDAPTAGSIVVGQQTVSSMSGRERTKFRRETVGFVFEAFSLLPELTVAENIRLPLTIRRQKPDQSWYDQVTATLQVTDILGRRPDELTPAQYQRVACARASIAHPALVVADEPTGDLDSQAAASLLAALGTCTANLGMTILVATHDPGVAASSDQVYFLRDGVVADTVTAPTLDQVIDKLRALSMGGSVR